MLKKTKKGYWVLEEFQKKKDVGHGFSSRQFGNMMVKKSFLNNKKINDFISLLGFSKKNLVMMEQVHQDRIKVVDDTHLGEVVGKVDGLVTDRPGIVLGIKTADCLPILFYDPVAKVIGAVHAGWRGVLAKTPQKMIDVMIKIGCSPLNIIIGVGPYIGSCCYLIHEERAQKFIREFGNLKRMLVKRKKGFYLDLMVPTKAQLICSGVSEVNIYSNSVCNSCHLDDFFSYRKDTAETYGEMLSVIGLTTGENEKTSLSEKN